MMGNGLKRVTMLLAGLIPTLVLFWLTLWFWGDDDFSYHRRTIFHFSDNHKDLRRH